MLVRLKTFLYLRRNSPNFFWRILFKVLKGIVDLTKINPNKKINNPLIIFIFKVFNYVPDFLYFIKLRFLRFFEPRSTSKKEKKIKIIEFYTLDTLNFFNRFTKVKNKWNNITLTNSTYADYYIVIDHPNNGLFKYYNPKKTIILQREPKEVRKEWGKWYIPDRKKFLHVHDIENNKMITEWYLDKTYDELSNEDVKKTKDNVLSVIMSDNYVLPGHIKRIDLLENLDKESGLDIDIYGRANIINSKIDKMVNYKGELPNLNKDVGMFPYKYHFNAENYVEKNYFTEKIIDPILSETLCFYWGCPNIEEFIDPRAYIKIDIDNHEEAIRVIKESIKNNEWEKRIDIIRSEKKRILNEMQIMPMLEKIINESNSKN